MCVMMLLPWLGYRLPQVVSYKDLYGWTMDEIVAQVGTRNNCTFCGVFRRQALDRGAQLIKADKVCWPGRQAAVDDSVKCRGASLCISEASADVPV